MTNPRIEEFKKHLRARDYDLRLNWEAKRNGGSRAAYDVFHYTIVGDNPKSRTIIVVDYGERDGFGLYLDSHAMTIEGTVTEVIKGFDAVEAK